MVQAAARSCSGARAPWGTGRQVGGNRAVERAQDLDEPIAVALHERLPPGAVVDRKAERQVVEELVGDHDTDDRPVGHDGDGLDTVRVRCRCTSEISTAT